MDGVLYKGTAECKLLESVELATSETEVGNFPALVTAEEAKAGFIDSLPPGTDVKNVEVEQEVSTEMSFATRPDMSTPQARNELVFKIAAASGIDCSEAGVDCLTLVQIDWAALGVDVSGRRLQAGFKIPLKIKNPPGKTLNASKVTDPNALAAGMAQQGLSVTITKTPTAVSKIKAAVTGTAEAQNAISSASLAASINSKLPAARKVDSSKLSQVSASQSAPAPAPGAGGNLGQSGSGATLQQTVIEDKDDDDLIAVIVAESIVVGVLLIVLVMLCMRNTANGKPSSGASA
jgi:hypothetical protein